MASILLCKLRGLTVVHSISTTVGEEWLVWSTAMYERSEKEMKRMRRKFRSLHCMPATFHRDVDERLVGSVQTQPMRAFHSCFQVMRSCVTGVRSAREESCCINFLLKKLSHLCPSGRTLKQCQKGSAFLVCAYEDDRVSIPSLQTREHIMPSLIWRPSEVALGMHNNGGLNLRVRIVDEE
jgi:hypothetical protein